MEFSFVFCSFLALLTISSGRRIPDSKFCADPECKTPISTAYTLMTFGSDHPKILSFKAKEKVFVYSKPTDNNPNLLDVEIGGKRGFAPKNLIREEKVLTKNVSYLVLVKEESEQKSINKSNVENTGAESANKNKVGEGKISEVVAELNATDEKVYKNEGEHLPDNITVFNNETHTSSASVIPDEADNQTEHLSSATSPETVQVLETKSHSMQYSTVAHFQRKLNAVNEAEDSGERSQESNAKIDNRDVLFSDSEEHKDEDDEEEVVEEEEEEEVEEEEEEEEEDENEEDEDESSHNEQELDEEYDLSNKTDVDKSERSSDAKKEETSINGVPDEKQKAVEAEMGSEGTTDSNLNFKSDGVDKSVNDTVQQFTQHNVTNFDVSLNYSKITVSDLKTQSTVSNNTAEQQETQKTSYDGKDSGAVVNPHKEKQKFDYHTTFYIPPILKATADELTSSKQQPQKKETESRDLQYHATSEFFDSEVDKNVIGSESKAKAQLPIESELKETLQQEYVSAENTIGSVGSDEKSHQDYISSKEPGSTETSTHTADQISYEKLSVNTVPQSQAASDLEANNFSSEDLKSNLEGIKQESSETGSYFSDNKSAPRKESFSLEDDVTLPLTTEKSPTESLIDEIMVTSDNIITTESTISLELQPHYVTNDEVAKISQHFEDNSDLMKSSGSKSLPEKLSGEETAAKNVNSEGFFESIILTVKGISQLGFGSQSSEQKGELQAESKDAMQGSSLWNSDHTLQDAASHVATDPDQTGHKVDVEVPSGNDHHSMSSTVCESGISCSGQSGLIPNEPQQQESSMSEDHEQSAQRIDVTEQLYGTLSDNALYMIITAIVTACVLAFTVMVSHFLQKPRFIALTSNIFKLEKQILCLKTENSTLREELQKRKEELSFIQISSVDTDKTLIQLNLKLKSSEAAKTELEEQVASLEKELEAATEAGLELNRMLSDFLSTQHGSETLVKSVEHLQKQLDAQQLTIVEMNNNLTAKNQENETLQQELAAATEKLAVQEEELKKTTDSLVNIQKEKIDLMSEMGEKIKALQLQLSQISESTHSQITRLTSDLEEARETVAMRDSELTVLQDCLRQLKALEEGQGSERLDALLDVGHARAELALVTMDRDSFKDRLHDEEVARKLLEDHVRVVKEEVNTLRSKFEEAEKEKVEAQTKLEVLSNYFKEKETQLQRELGLQEAMYIQKEGDATNTYERIKSLQEEIEHYKLQNDMLKKEIIDQERSLKGQLATLEKKAHENWVAARQAERKLEESRQEAGQLRNRLTIIEKNITNTSQNSLETSKVVDRLQAADSNGEIPTSFLHMGMPEMQEPSYHQHRDRDGHPVSPPLIPGQPLPPFMAIPPPGVFMPPPPLPGAPFVPPPPPPLFPGDRRPPPLGRMSSPPPPPPHRYSPEPRGDFSPYDNSPPLSSHGYDDDDDSPPHRYHHRSPPPPLGPYPPPPPPPRQLSRWDDPHSSFRPLPPVHRESPRDSKGSALSSGHSSESLDKSSRHSGRV